MASEPEVHPATLKFQLALPRTAQSISPTLAAIHVARARLLHHTKRGSHTFDTTHCRKCGTYLLGGTGTVRTIRRRKARACSKPISRVLRRSCSVCGGEQDVPVDASSSYLFPRVGKKPISSSPKSQLTPQPEPVDEQKVPMPLAVALPASPDPFSSARFSSRPSPAPESSKPRPMQKPPIQDPKSVGMRSKARVKKKLGLQDMLARSKERQEKERAGLNGGLAAFLQNL